MMAPKKQAQEKKGQWKVQESLASSSSFITLKLGRNACERLLGTGNPTTVKWIRDNTLLFTQARTIEQRYLQRETLSHEESPKGYGARVTRVPPAASQASAASQAESIDVGEYEPDANNEVSAISVASFLVSGALARLQLSHVVYECPSWSRRRLRLGPSSN